MQRHYKHSEISFLGVNIERQRKHKVELRLLIACRCIPSTTNGYLLANLNFLSIVSSCDLFDLNFNIGVVTRVSFYSFWSWWSSSPVLDAPSPVVSASVSEFNPLTRS